VSEQLGLRLCINGGLMARAEHVQKALSTMRSKIPNSHATVMVDCSHGNSSKNHLNQPKVALNVGEQVAAGETGIIGVMFESNLKGGKQAPATRDKLEYGVSITDACVDWESTVEALDGLNKVRGRHFLGPLPEILHSREGFSWASDGHC
jgi:3-deoxy-7-phosphoheptulonate synthase